MKFAHLSTGELWETFCRLRMQSAAYRACDDPLVEGAYNDWLASYLAEEKPAKSKVIPFRKPRGRE